MCGELSCKAAFTVCALQPESVPGRLVIGPVQAAKAPACSF
jgi:hypothetical protein